MMLYEPVHRWLRETALAVGHKLGRYGDIGANGQHESDASAILPFILFVVIYRRYLARELNKWA
jgi:hypothetical protein